MPCYFDSNMKFKLRKLVIMNKPVLKWLWIYVVDSVYVSGNYCCVLCVLDGCSIKLKSYYQFFTKYFYPPKKILHMQFVVQRKSSQEANVISSETSVSNR